MRNVHKKRVLFVCIGNSCRSPMAEAIARYEAPDVLEVTSAGLAPLGSVAALSLQTLKKNGYPAENLSSKPISREAFDASDIVINMSGYSGHRAFLDGSKVEDWDIDDPYGADPEVYQRIFESIRVKVLDLVARLRAETKQKP